ncbi:MULTISPECIES: isocitrate lyase/phosphoenolpyruvate mutase family protein [unclassified Rathayibacter]|uniref:isocitrate lyase/PEP mutase family protein n=1 Tax=unclassified Rathayibacter TaxID=2609250 RepID=UPI0010493E56|nr:MULTISPECIES: isocitrate lyase/phosphoenolpyruvate mutase family protein [unclassified Rathayibacter]TCL85472.1 2-methylisocitrate lyase-like PEP mutase family enzyme [Rathayibacter sp. PhB192]TCM31293.1 2-methylisocitrate lyase-like PEP mutase family enzyme [Rathayibacter sp. PhB179]
MSIEARGRTLVDLHTAPELLSVVNVWDVVSATTITALPETRALATASHSIAATFGYEDGERIPLDLHLSMIERIVAAVDVPVSADLEAGYGDAGETVRRAIEVGVVGANLEDQAKPLAEALRSVEKAVAAAEEEAVPFALNARTDVFLRAGDRDRGEVLADAIERGRAYLDAGATCFFVPGLLQDAELEALVAELGRQRVSVIGVPGSQSPARFEELGLARVSYGPWTQRVALTALQDAATALYAGGALPEGTRPLN